MGPKYVTTPLACILLLVLFGFARSDFKKDKEKCQEQLVALVGCIPYVGGEAKAPTIDCCTGLKQVLDKSKECLCILVKDRNSPELGLNINATLALSLPDKCHVPADVSQCPALLHLAPNSPDAKVFEDFAKSSKGTNSTPTAEVKGSSSGKATSANSKSDGGRRRWLETETTLGLLVAMMLHILPNA